MTRSGVPRQAKAAAQEKAKKQKEIAASKKAANKKAKDDRQHSMVQPETTRRLADAGHTPAPDLIDSHVLLDDETSPIITNATTVNVSTTDAATAEQTRTASVKIETPATPPNTTAGAPTILGPGSFTHLGQTLDNFSTIVQNIDPLRRSLVDIHTSLNQKFTDLDTTLKATLDQHTQTISMKLDNINDRFEALQYQHGGFQNMIDGGFGAIGRQIEGLGKRGRSGSERSRSSSRHVGQDDFYKAVDDDDGSDGGEQAHKRPKLAHAVSEADRLAHIEEAGNLMNQVKKQMGFRLSVAAQPSLNDTDRTREAMSVGIKDEPPEERFSDGEVSEDRAKAKDRAESILAGGQVVRSIEVAPLSPEEM